MKQGKMEEEKKERKFFVIVHNIRSSYNVGSVFRSSDALGVDKIFLGGYSPNPGKNKAVCKTALGSEEYVPWEAVWHTHKLIEDLAGQGVKTVALEQSNSSVGLDDFMPSFPMALLLGNEVKGLSKKMLEYVDQVVEIPMLGKKESLNVSVAFGIATHQILLKK
ncbi:MAG: TrmH family RNA methyltransferase [Patescibacteria group bacterium]|nr:TrmH family RNA methyltransferase [Patescibacteria group bacterium]